MIRFSPVIRVLNRRYAVFMAAANYFTSHGYLVFAYDATGNDDSEGESVIGMEQGIIDLSYAISYVE